ncbi:hypothetical protein SS50377_26420 [Spironucleus salmonicida]|uniref:Uncharacterized protein n=1 Tax=Spironucleus salmonicida TaxID=348837 RepID=V6LU08_9EUKA|nr:hypothetical protein SS50377_26420 [Spironucleus salmonicida]|eukprot:EST47713.1 Hypothetical protein SS50377_12109 [Spironucleus salmonicida]
MRHLKYLIANQLKTPTRRNMFNFTKVQFELDQNIVEQLNLKIVNVTDLHFSTLNKPPNAILRFIRAFKRLKNNSHIVSLDHVDFQVTPPAKCTDQKVIQKTQQYYEFRKSQTRQQRVKILEQIEFDVHIGCIRNQPVTYRYREVSQILKNYKDKLF